MSLITSNKIYYKVSLVKIIIVNIWDLNIKEKYFSLIITTWKYTCYSPDALVGPEVNAEGNTGQYTEEMKDSNVLPSLYWSMIVFKALPLSS